MTSRERRIADFIEAFRVEPGSKVTLAKDFDPAFKARSGQEAAAVELLARGGASCWPSTSRGCTRRTPTACWWCCRRSTPAGKDGTIRHVMSGVNPQGVSVHSFKVPSAEELDHDYLWRYSAAAPGPRGDRHLQPLALRGGAGRPRAPGAPRPPAASAGRAGRTVEAALPRDQRVGAPLIDNGIADREALPEPLARRSSASASCGGSTCPTTTGSSLPPTSEERERWDDYQRAFSEMLSHTSTEWAPWYVIPADRKWFARISAAAVIANTLIEIDPRYPTIGRRRHGTRCRRSRRRLEAQAPEGAAPDPFEAEQAEKADDEDG